jgi:hypothetical protein
VPYVAGGSSRISSESVGRIFGAGTGLEQLAQSQASEQSDKLGLQHMPQKISPKWRATLVRLPGEILTLAGESYQVSLALLFYQAP